MFEKGLLKVANLVANTITANQFQLKDEDTGEIYCVKIKNGKLINDLGVCGQEKNDEDDVESTVLIESAKDEEVATSTQDQVQSSDNILEQEVAEEEEEIIEETEGETEEETTVEVEENSEPTPPEEPTAESVTEEPEVEVEHDLEPVAEPEAAPVNEAAAEPTIEQ